MGAFQARAENVCRQGEPQGFVVMLGSNLFVNREEPVDSWLINFSIIRQGEPHFQDPRVAFKQIHDGIEWLTCVRVDLCSAMMSAPCVLGGSVRGLHGNLSNIE